MQETFTFNTKIAETILESYKNFLNFQPENDSYDNYYIRSLQLFRELDIERLCNILQQSFNASLMKEEGKHHNFSLVISPPESKFKDLLNPHLEKHSHGQFNNVCSFEKPIAIEYLPKIAPAFESTNRKLHIWFNDKNEIEIWGFANNFFNHLAIEIKSFSSGQILVHIKAMDFAYERYLVLLTESKYVIRHDNLIELLFNEFSQNQQTEISDREKLIQINRKKEKRYWFLLDVINKMMNHKHGGTLLFINQEDSQKIFEQSIKSVSYHPISKYEYIEKRLMTEDDKDINLSRTAKEANFIARTTAVDGATIINKDFGILGFGAKIKPKENSTEDEDRLDYVWIKEPFENFLEGSTKLSKIGGMRHQSTAQFVFDQREKNVFAIVASEDGKVSIMYWDSNCIWTDEEEKQKKGIVTMLRHVEYLFYGMNI